MIRICPVCKETEIVYKTFASFDRACKKGTMCSSCRTSKNNKSPKRNTVKENNPAWRGFKDIPGKVLSKLKRDAEKRDLDFALTMEDIWNAYVNQSKVCRFSGVPLVWGENASVDRIDSSLGYFFENIQIVHKSINIMKRDMDDKHFIQWCNLIADNAII
jgi:hypothetical protein